jgi:rhamnosyltransferase
VQGGVAVVVPTLNAGPRLTALLDGIRSQVIDQPVRVVAVDSGSTDGTVRTLEAYGATVLHVARGSFNHGATRNHALAAVTEEFAALLVQDAVPASPQWLAALTAPLTADPAIAGSYARQLPWPDARRTTKYYLGRSAVSATEPVTRGPLDAAGFSRMTPHERHEVCQFDNVSSCIRMAVWRSHPFEPVRFAEDLGWARRVLLAGHRLAYVPEAVVWHSHDRSVAYELRRAYLAHERLQQLFGLSTIPTRAACLRAVAATLPLHVRLALRDPRGWRGFVHSVALAAALPYGQYLGARAARERRTLLRVTGI